MSIVTLDQRQKLIGPVEQCAVGAKIIRHLLSKTWATREEARAVADALTAGQGMARVDEFLPRADFAEYEVWAKDPETGSCSHRWTLAVSDEWGDTVGGLHVGARKVWT